MGLDLSSTYFQGMIEETKAFNAILKVIYRESDIKIMVGTTVGSPGVLLRDIFGVNPAIGDVAFLVSFRKCTGYTVSDALHNEEISRKRMSFEQYSSFKGLLYNLRNSLAAGSAPSSIIRPREECSICLNALVEVALPCSHSFCSKCAADWRQNSDTCPCCRNNMIEASCEWQIEDWSQDDLKEQFFSLCKCIDDFLSGLPPVTNSFISSHRILGVTDDHWQIIPSVTTAENRLLESTSFEQSDLKVNKFMGR